METNRKMKVEIWSDTMCSHCYMAKRQFEKALSQFKEAGNIEIIWRSFQLAHDLKSEPDKNFFTSLTEYTGMSMEQALEASNHLTNLAKEVGLDYYYNNIKPANTFRAHQLSHLAKHKGLQNEAEEQLFKAYFTEGRNINDIDTLVEIGISIGLDSAETKTHLENNSYAPEVTNDIELAKQSGIRSVPHYIFNGTHTLSGSQDSQTFLQNITAAYTTWSASVNSGIHNITKGATCNINGECN